MEDHNLNSLFRLRRVYQWDTLLLIVLKCLAFHQVFCQCNYWCWKEHLKQISVKAALSQHNFWLLYWMISHLDNFCIVYLWNQSIEVLSKKHNDSHQRKEYHLDKYLLIYQHLALRNNNYSHLVQQLNLIILQVEHIFYQWY